MQGDEKRDGARERILEKGKAVAKPDEQETRRPIYHPYPEAAAKYEEVVANPELFKNTLERLHSMMGTKYMVPIVGGRDLDLHRLFVEVTSRGGIEKLVAEKRMKEVTSVFNFPSTATNASFILRKYYMSLLHHYEQIYFFGSQGRSLPDSSNTLSLNHVPSDRLVVPVVPSYESQIALLNRGRNIAASNAFSLNTAPSNRLVASVTPSYESQLTLLNPGRYNGQSLIARPHVVGIIDGKFEHGYFVTVTVGSTKLRGVLYPVPERTTVQVPQYSGIVDDSYPRGIQNQQCNMPSMRDSGHPRPKRSGYNFFFDEQHARLKLNSSASDREISKMIGELWNKLTETEKAVYQERGLRDKERYRNEMAIYRERQRVGQVITHAVPLRQCPMEQASTSAGPSSAGPSHPIIDLTQTNEDDSNSDDDKDYDVDNDDDDDASTVKISDGDSEGETTLVLGDDETESSSSTEQSTEGRSV